jgi:hypothetical protein
VLLLVLFAGAATTANFASGAAGKPASSFPWVNSVRVVREHGVAAVEIVSTHTLVPTIQTLDSPPRLVIDLPNARLGLARKRIVVRQDNIVALRAEQFRQDPPVTRVVVDLLAPNGYTWDSAGNRLMVRLKPAGAVRAAAEKSPVVAPAIPTLATGPVPVLAPVSRGPGYVVLAGTRVGAGSSVTAGSETAVLRLTRGGEIRVCPGTTVSVTPSKNQHDLMLGLSTGALEAHYMLDASADSVVTPDFRILFPGPGEFDYAISADTHGNTCVRGLMGNSSSVIVSELMGDRIYQVKPSEQVVFHAGQIAKVGSEVPLECGCPPPTVPVMRASGEPSAPNSASASVHFANASMPAEGMSPNSRLAEKNSSPMTLSSGPETAPLPPSQPNEVHIQVDAPFVFMARNRAANVPPPPVLAASLSINEGSVRPVYLDPVVQPPREGAKAQAEHHGFFRRLKGFLAAIFG